MSLRKNHHLSSSFNKNRHLSLNKRGASEFPRRSVTCIHQRCCSPHCCSLRGSPRPRAESSATQASARMQTRNPLSGLHTSTSHEAELCSSTSHHFPPSTSHHFPPSTSRHFPVSNLAAPRPRLAPHRRLAVPHPLARRRARPAPARASTPATSPPTATATTAATAPSTASARRAPTAPTAAPARIAPSAQAPPPGPRRRPPARPARAFA